MSDNGNFASGLAVRATALASFCLWAQRREIVDEDVDVRRLVADYLADRTHEDVVSIVSRALDEVLEL